MPVPRGFRKLPKLGWTNGPRRRDESRRGTLRACATGGLDVATNGDTARKNACATKELDAFTQLVAGQATRLLTFSTMWRAEIPNLSSSSAGLPLRAMPPTASLWTSAFSVASAASTASPMPPCG